VDGALTEVHWLSEVAMSIRVDDTIALVTGAAGGIGREVCRALQTAGATVIATDLQAPRDVCATLSLQHDVTSEGDWQAVAETLRTRHERLDALVNVAAIAPVASIETLSIEQWRKVQAVNVESILIGMRTLLPLLKISGKSRPGGASIVNFSSVAGLRGAALTAAYCASKGAVTLLTKCAAIEFAALGYNIRVNSVHPGGIQTEMLRSIMQTYVELGATKSFEDAEAGVIAQHPIGRLARPDELGGGVVYLCSAAASFVTGSELVIDGGFTAI
jgi:NAD(P)-dependent dehydrogenase (short-subunit alcohol dehydrogenase family)